MSKFPFVLLQFLVVLAILLFPDLALWLPRQILAL
jgi:TRAP-type mannitol/chloroaromatic compound transport system permease large subunit